jgi:hypothetical protein
MEHPGLPLGQPADNTQKILMKYQTTRLEPTRYESEGRTFESFRARHFLSMT